MLSIKWFLGINSTRFFLDFFFRLWDESMPTLKHNIQDKDKLRYSKVCVKKYPKD